MRIGEWENLGRTRQLLQQQLAEMGATEFATHVTVNEDTGRLRIFVASDMGLMDYQYAPAGTNPGGAWILRGQLHRWPTVRNLRLQTDAQLHDDTIKSVWRLSAEDPKIELIATSDHGEREIEAVLSLARACLQHAG
jgi:hypothetical protein